MTEDEFVAACRKPPAKIAHPPMPWVNLALANEQDLRAMYRFVKGLGPKGDPAPEFVPPDQEPKTPYVSFAPVTPK
jgi:hypothetical protein